MPQAVYFLLLPNVLSLDVSGPAETLRLAGQFSLRYLSPVPQIVCSIGMTLSGLQPLPERRKTAPSGAAGRRRFAALFRRGRGRAGTSLAGDAAARSAAAAHHRCASAPARCWRRRPGCSTAISAPPTTTLSSVSAGRPAAQVKENRIFVEDRGVYTSAGITTGIDLALHWSIATAAPAGRATSPAIWWSISAAPGTIRSCRPGCATATTCTRRCTARRT